MQSADGRDEVNSTDVGTAKIVRVRRMILKEARWVESVSSLAYCKKGVWMLIPRYTVESASRAGC